MATKEITALQDLEQGRNGSRTTALQDLEQGRSVARRRSLEIDGTAIGEELMERVKERGEGKSKEEAVKDFIQENETLRELTETYGFAEAMLFAVLDNKIYRLMTVQGSAQGLAEEGRSIGQSLAQGLIINTMASIAVDEWFLQFDALQEIEREYDWF